MDDNDWDIGAVVRNCNINKSNNVVAPNLDLESLIFENDDWNKFLNVDGTSFNCFSETSPMNFSVDQIINPITPAPIIMDQSNNQQMLQVFEPAQLGQQMFLPPLPPPPTAMHVNEPTTVTELQEWIDLQQHAAVLANDVHPTLTLPMSAPLIQTPKKRNHRTKIIYELMQEKIMDDTWIWKKNGEKNIATSLYPRNYYRCATSKDCKATKQIEKSPRGGNLFLVAYSGEHNHPPPINPKRKLSRGINIVPKPLNLNSSATSLPKRSKRSRVIASPTIPTMPMLEIESASPNKNEMMVVATETKGDEGEKENIV